MEYSLLKRLREKALLMARFEWDAPKTTKKFGKEYKRLVNVKNLPAEAESYEVLFENLFGFVELLIKFLVSERDRVKEKFGVEVLPTAAQILEENFGEILEFVSKNDTIGSGDGDCSPEVTRELQLSVEKYMESPKRKFYCKLGSGNGTGTREGGGPEMYDFPGDGNAGPAPESPMETPDSPGFVVVKKESFPAVAYKEVVLVIPPGLMDYQEMAELSDMLDMKLGFKTIKPKKTLRKDYFSVCYAPPKLKKEYLRKANIHFVFFDIDDESIYNFCEQRLIGIKMQAEKSNPTEKSRGSRKDSTLDQSSRKISFVSGASEGPE